MKKLQVMIVSLPGTWQRVLKKNIETYSFVETVHTASGSLSASQFVNHHQPEVILIDSSIPSDDAVALIQKLKEENPKTVLVVLTDTTQQKRRISRSGANYTISSANYEAQLSEILTQIKETSSDEKQEKKEASKKASTGQMGQASGREV